MVNQYEQLARKEWQTCEGKDKESELNCLFHILYQITEAQDITNLHLIRVLNKDDDERWYPIHMVDNANAIILDITKHRGWPKPIIKYHYTEEKINALMDKWKWLLMITEL